MATTAQLTAAPMQITLGDKNYSMSPLSDVGVGELDNWLAARIIKVARDSLPADATPAIRKETMEMAFNIASTMTWYSKLGSEILGGTLEGVARLIWQCCKPNHPELDVATVRKAILDPRTYQAAIDAFNYTTRGTKTAAPDDKIDDTPIDKTEIYKILSEKYGWTPEQIADLTNDQIEAYLVEDTVKFDSPAAAAAYIKSKKK